MELNGLRLKDISCIQFGFGGLRLKDKSQKLYSVWV